MNSIQRVEILAEHLLDFADVRRPPVPVALVQVVADVRLIYMDWHYHHGYLYQQGDVFYLAVNGNDPEGERRFTIFHELFHVIERIQPAFRLAAPASWHGELLADHFAVSVLLSNRWFQACLRACNGDVQAIAHECGVSPVAVLKKIATLHN